MRSYPIVRWVLGLGVVATALGAAPAPTSYHEVQRKVEAVRSGWQGPDAQPPSGAEGWNRFFDALLGELDAYARAPDENARLRSLGRIYEMSRALGGVAWAPAQSVRGAVREWLRPRVALAWAQRRLIDSVRGPDRAAEGDDGRSDRWAQFVDSRLAKALRDYESAPTVALRVDALGEIHASLEALQKSNEQHAWAPSVSLQAALADLFNVQNVDLTLDNATVAAFAGRRGLVEPGWIFFKGNWSYATPGPITGAGLVPVDGGIGFQISQAVHTYTPISGFQQQLAQDPQGQRAAKLYQFDASSTNDAVLTITGIFRTATGLQLSPSYLHNISATVNSVPQAGNGLGRLVASLVGMNQRKITDKVYEGAFPKIAEGVVEGAGELAGIRVSRQVADLNARIRPYVLNTSTIGADKFGLAELAMRSDGGYGYIQGTVIYLDPAPQFGASMPQPIPFQSIQPGVMADVHLPSLLSNLARGLLQSERIRDIENVMLITGPRPQPGEEKAPGEGLEQKNNVSYEEYLKAIAESQSNKDVQTQVIRFFKPGVPPQFGADAAGNLVILLRDFTLEVPAPPSAQRGGLAGPPAKVYRITSPRTEVVINFAIRPPVGDQPPRFTGKVLAFDPGPGSVVYAINDDPEKAVPLNAFTAAIITRILQSRIGSETINVPLAELQNRQIRLTWASALDPSGWIRLLLAP